MTNQIQIGDKVYCEAITQAQDIGTPTRIGIQTFRFNGIVQEINGDMLRLDHDQITVKRSRVVKVETPKLA